MLALVNNNGHTPVKHNQYPSFEQQLQQFANDIKGSSSSTNRTVGTGSREENCQSHLMGVEVIPDYSAFVGNSITDKKELANIQDLVRSDLAAFAGSNHMWTRGGNPSEPVPFISKVDFRESMDSYKANIPYCNGKGPFAVCVLPGLAPGQFLTMPMAPNDISGFRAFDGINKIPMNEIQLVASTMGILVNQVPKIKDNLRIELYGILLDTEPGTRMCKLLPSNITKNALTIYASPYDPQAIDGNKYTSMLCDSRCADFVNQHEKVLHREEIACVMVHISFPGRSYRHCVVMLVFNRRQHVFLDLGPCVPIPGEGDNNDTLVDADTLAANYTSACKAVMSMHKAVKQRADWYLEQAQEFLHQIQRIVTRP
jgi:hypothetical protein